MLYLVQTMKQMVTFELFSVSTGYYSERQAIAEAQSPSACYFFNIKLIYSKVNLFDSWSGSLNNIFFFYIINNAFSPLRSARVIGALLGEIGKDGSILVSKYINIVAICMFNNKCLFLPSNRNFGNLLW